MSLEDLLKKSNTGDNFKKKLVHYAKYTVNSIYRSALDVFRMPTANRLRTQAEPLRNPTFLEDLITSTSKCSVQVITLGSLFFCPPLLATALGTNIASYAYEIYLNKKKIDNKEPIKTKKEIINEQTPTKESSSSKFARKLKSWPAKLKRWPRKLATYACTYTLVGSLALGHLFVSNKLGINEQYNPKLVNVGVQKILLEKEGQKYEFYLLGEFHLYNYSSSVYAEKLIEEKKINLFLSEGVGYAETPSLEEVAKTKLDSNMGWRNFCETALGLTQVVMALGSGYVYYSPSEICYEKGIPVIFLEKPAVRNTDENSEYKKEKKEDLPPEQRKDQYVDGREGISDASYVALGVLGVGAMAFAPTMYFFMTPARHFSFPKYHEVLPVDLVFGGLLHERNKLMAENSLKQMNKNPGSVCLIRVGAAHVEGMIEEFKKYGEIKVEKINTIIDR